MQPITIYADVLFFINFAVDFLCLYITGKLICAFTRTWRLFSAACIGGAYSCLAIYFEALPWYISAALHIAAAFVICAAAFGNGNLAVATGVFAVSCALTGGMMCGVYAITGNSFYAGGGFYFDVDPIFVVVFAAASSVSSLLYLLLCKRRKSCGDATVGFVFRGSPYKAHLLCDSGCFLRDAVSGSPVIIVTKSVFGDTLDLNGADEKTLRELGKTARLVPVRTVSGTGVLAAFKPEAVTVSVGGRRKTVSAIIAVDCGETAYGGFEGIISSELC